MVKRIASLLLSAAMAVGLCVPALAAEAGGGGGLTAMTGSTWSATPAA